MELLEPYDQRSVKFAGVLEIKVGEQPVAITTNFGRIRVRERKEKEGNTFNRVYHFGSPSPPHQVG